LFVPSFSPSFVADGSGFALLQSHAPSYQIIIEKAPQQFQISQRRHRSALICDGDTVLIKIVNKDDVRYLSTHRGWWLKWVSTPPRNNGYFHILSRKSKEIDVDETSGAICPYIFLDALFSLRHRRWSHYEVGVSEEGSVKFGGRLLGLHRATDSSGNYVAESDRNFDSPDYVDRKGEKRWLSPLQLCASLPTSAKERNVSNLLKTSSTEDQSLQLHERNIDASAWIEMAHRNNRTKQRAYIVRVSPTKETGRSCDSESAISGTAGARQPFSEDEGKKSDECQYFRLRTGRDLTPILQLARTIRGEGGAERSLRSVETTVGLGVSVALC